MIPRYQSPVGVWDFFSIAVGRLADSPRSETVTIGQSMLMPSASDALFFALRKIGATGSVILPAYNCIKVVKAIWAAGWVPVFVDVDLATGSMLQADLRKTLERLSGQKAILATHLHGVPNAMAPLIADAKHFNAIIIEDCAMAQGAIHQGMPVGSFGDWAIFSFGLGKVLSFGAGGALLCKDVANRIEMREALPQPAYFSPILSRLGSIGWVRFHAQEFIKQWLPSLARSTQEQSYKFQAGELSAAASRSLHLLLESQNVKQYIEQQKQRSLDWLSFVDELRSHRLSAFTPIRGDNPCYPGLPLIVEDRAALQSSLRKQGVDSARYFDYCAARLSGDPGSFPNSEYLAQRSLVLPLYQMTEAKANVIRRVLRSHAFGECK